MLIFNQNFHLFTNKNNQNNNKNNFIYFGVKNIPRSLKPIKELTKDFFAVGEDNISSKKMSSLFTEIIAVRKGSHISSSVFDQFFHDDFLNFLKAFTKMHRFSNKLFEKFVEAFRRSQVESGSQESKLLKGLTERYIKAGGEDSTVLEHCETGFTSIFKKRNKSFLTREQQAKQVEKNLGLVDWVIKQFFGTFIVYKHNNLYNEFFQEGSLGLSIAAEQWNPRKGRISTYAPYWIRSKISRFISNNSLVQIPDSARIRMRKVEEFQEKFKAKNGYCPNYEDIVKATGMSQRYISGKKQTILGSELAANEEESFILDRLNFDAGCSPIDNLIRREDDKLAKDILTKNPYGLTEREISILKMYFGFDGENLNYAQIGKTMNLTRERIRKIYNGAIRKLKIGICPDNRTLDLIKIRETVAADPEKRKLLIEKLDTLSGKKSCGMLRLCLGLDGEKKKYREIAKEYGISVPAVRSNLELIVANLEKDREFTAAFNKRTDLN